MQRKWRPSSVAQCMWHYAFVGAMSTQPFGLQHLGCTVHVALCIRGCYVYSAIWTAALGQTFPIPYERETGNSSDRYAASCPRLLKPLVLYLTIRCSNCLFQYIRLIEAIWGLVVCLLAEGISKIPLV